MRKSVESGLHPVSGSLNPSPLGRFTPKLIQLSLRATLAVALLLAFLATDMVTSTASAQRLDLQSVTWGGSKTVVPAHYSRTHLRFNEDHDRATSDGLQIWFCASSFSRGQTLTFDIELTGTATLGLDYRLRAKDVRSNEFPTSESTRGSYILKGTGGVDCAHFALIFIDDQVDEIKYETIVITIHNLEGATYGVRDTTIEIVDNDANTGATFHTREPTTLPSILSEDLFGRERGTGLDSFDSSKHYLIGVRKLPSRGVTTLEISFKGTAEYGVDYLVVARKDDDAPEGMVIRNPTQSNPLLRVHVWKEKRSERRFWFRIKVLDDSIEEDTESIIMDINPGNLEFDGVRGPRRKTMRIFDNDRPAPAAEAGVTISRAPNSITETLSSWQLQSPDNFRAEHEVRLTIPSHSVILTLFFSVEGTATRCADYVINEDMFSGDSDGCNGEATTATILLAPRTTAYNFRFRAVDDDIYEPGGEQIVVNLGQDSQGNEVSRSIDLDENDELPLITISSPRVVEGEAGDPTTLRYEVTKSGGSVSPVTVEYEISDKTTAISGGNDGDYTYSAGSPLTFEVDEMLKEIEVTVHGDGRAEADETVVVRLHSPVAARFAGGADAIEGTGTIENDDFLELSISDKEVVEGNAGDTTAMTFTVELGAETPADVTVEYAVTGGDAEGEATAGEDFTATSGMLTFMSGDPLTQTFDVMVTGDDLTEPNETLTVTLSNPQCVDCPAGITASLKSDEDTATGTILDDEGVLMSISTPEVSEGDAGQSPMLIFDVTLSKVGVQEITVDYSVLSTSTAESGSDFEAVADGTLRFDHTQDETTMTVPVAVTGDATYEEDETVLVELSGLTGGAQFPVSASTITGMGTITNDDSAPLLTISSNIEDDEGDADGTTVLSFVVTKAGATALPATVNYAFAASSTATATGEEADFTHAIDSPLTFSATETTKMIEVAVVGDAIAENDETVVVELSSPDNARFTSPATTIEGTGTITNDDDFPLLSFAPLPTVDEGAAGDTTMLRFEVIKGGETALPATVNYAISGTAVAAGDDADYTHADTSLNIAVDQESAYIDIAVNGDDLFEADETVIVTLSGPGNAGFAAGATELVGMGTIANDDFLRVSVETEDVVEGGEGDETTLTFTVILEARSLEPVTVDYEVIATGPNSGTANYGTGGAGADFTAATPAGSLTFPADTAAPQMRTFEVLVYGDLDREPSETVVARLHSLSANAEFPGGSSVTELLGTATIINDDDPSFTVGAVRVDEGAAGETATMTFEVTMFPEWNEVVTVDYEATGGTGDARATVDEDFRETSGTLTFNPGAVGTSGETLKTVTVEVFGDDYDEADEETVSLVLSNASSNARIQTAEWTGIIVDDDAPPVFSVNSPRADEGDAGLTDLVFLVSKTGETRLDTSVAFAVADGTAAGGERTTADYVPMPSGQLDFAPSEISKQVTVQVRGDSLAEADETLTVTLSSPALATIDPSRSIGMGIIANDDDLAFSIDSPSAEELDSGQTSFMIFAVTLESEAPADVTVNYEVTGGSAAGEATAGEDFTAASGTLTFTPGGGLTQEIEVSITGDVLSEGRETFTATISDLACATCPAGVVPRIETSTGTGTIIDNEVLSISIGDPSVNEGNAGDTPTLDFEVTLDFAWDQDVSVSYRVSTESTATSGVDFEELAEGTLTFESDQSEVSKTIQVRVIGDTLSEDSETVVVELHTATGNAVFIGLAAMITGTGTIANDDFIYAVVASSVSVAEPETGTVDLTFTVTLTPAATSEYRVRYTFGGTATEDFDFTDATRTSAPSVLTFGEGEFSKTIQMLVHSDFVAEDAETVTVTLVDENGVSFESATATAIIRPPATSVDPITIEVDSPQVTGGGGGGPPQVEFALSLSAMQSSDVTVDWVLSEITTEEIDPLQDIPLARAARFLVTIDEIASGTAILPVGDSESTVSAALNAGVDISSIDGQLVIEVDRPTGVDGIEIQQAAGISAPVQVAVDANGRVAAAVFHAPGTFSAGSRSRDWAITSALSGFGRSAAVSLVNTIWSRAEAHRHGGVDSHVSLGGRSVDVSAYSPGADARSAARETARVLGLETAEAYPSSADWADGEPHISGGLDDFRRWASLPDSDRIAGESSFALALGAGPAGGSSVVYWGAVSNGSFGSELEHDDGEFPILTTDGSSTAIGLGFDYRMSESMLMGLAVSSVSGSVEYSFAQPSDERGELSPSLNTFTPWLRWQSLAGLEVWGAFGFGSGSAEAAHGSEKVDMDISSQTIAAGFWNRVASFGSVGVAAKADAFIASLSTDGAGDAVDDAGAESQRIRLAAEMTPGYADSARRSTTYSFELGARQDGGEAESGVGVDAAGNFSYTSPGGGFQVSGRGSLIVFHGQDGFSETGLGLGLSYDPGGDSRGVQLSLEPTWNAPRTSAGNSMWNADSSGSMSLSSSEGALMKARLSYGVGMARERALATMYGESEAGESEHRLRLGAELSGENGPLERLRFDMYGEREESDSSASAHAVMLEARIGL